MRFNTIEELDHAVRAIGPVGVAARLHADATEGGPHHDVAAQLTIIADAGPQYWPIGDLFDALVETCATHLPTPAAA